MNIIFCIDLIKRQKNFKTYEIDSKETEEFEIIILIFFLKKMRLYYLADSRNLYVLAAHIQLYLYV